MSDRVRHPRLLAAFRVALYLTAGTVAVGVSVLAVATVGFVVAVGTVAVVAGWADLLPVVVLAALVVATTGGLVGALAVAARRIDREVTDADRSPDPVERAKQRYVEGRLDEAELERRLERLLGVGGGPGRDARERPADRVTTAERTRPERATGARRGPGERASAEGSD